MVESCDCRRSRLARAARRRAVLGTAKGTRGHHRRRDGQAGRSGARRGRLLRVDLRVLRRQRGSPDGGRADRAPRGSGVGRRPPQLAGRAAGDHAVELPLLPGRTLRGAEPDHRQHGPVETRAPVPAVGRGDGADVRRRWLPRRRLREHLRHERADRVGDRRPARPRRLGHRLRARRRRRRGDRRPASEEGRAGARRLRPVHRPRHRRPRQDGRGRRRRPDRQRAASRATARNG